MSDAAIGPAVVSYARSWRDGAERPNSAAERTRAAIREIALSILSIVARGSLQPSLRCIFAHHCFDDERLPLKDLIERLIGEGFIFVPAERVVAIAEGRVQPAARELHLSFDDGFANVLTNALPILERCGVPVTFFVPSVCIGTLPTSPRRHGVGLALGRRPIEMADWVELRAAAAHGLLEVGAHTATHVRLSDVSSDAKRLREEVADARAEIEDRLGRACRWFAAPYGQRADVDLHSIEAVRAAGYEALFRAYRGDVRPGSVNRWNIPRGHFEPHWPMAHVLYFARGGGAGTLNRHRVFIRNCADESCRA